MSQSAELEDPIVQEFLASNPDYEYAGPAEAHEDPVVQEFLSQNPEYEYAGPTEEPAPIEPPSPKGDAVDMFNKRVGERQAQNLDQQYSNFKGSVADTTKTLGSMAAYGAMYTLRETLYGLIDPKIPHFAGGTPAEIDPNLAFKDIKLNKELDAMEKGFIQRFGTKAQYLPMMALGSKYGRYFGTKGRVAGAMGGLVGAMLMEDGLRDILVSQGLTYDDIEEIPKELREQAYIGQNLGDVLANITGAQSVARSGFQAIGKGPVSRMVNQILYTAKKHPIASSASELTAGLYAYLGGNLTERRMGEGSRETGELVGSLVGVPIDMGKNYLFNTLIPGLSRKMKTFSDEKRLESAGEFIAEVFTKYGTEGGEDLSTIVKIAKELEPGEAGTLGQRTGSRIIAGLEKELAKSSPEFREIMQAQQTELHENMSYILNKIKSGGDPEVIKEIAEDEWSLFRNNLQSMVHAHMAAASDAAAKVPKGTDTNKIKSLISSQLNDVLEGALDTAEDEVSRLYANMPEVRLDSESFSNIIQAFSEIKDRTLKQALSKRLGPVAKKYMAMVDEFVEGVVVGKSVVTGAPVRKPSSEVLTTKNLTQFRSEMLELAREAGTDSPRNAKNYYELAAAALQDLDGMFINNEQYKTASRFVREMHDTFTRSFVGKALVVGSKGRRMHPRLVLQKAMAHGGEARELVFDEIREAGEFIATKGLDDVVMYNGEQSRAIDVIRDVQERILRLEASEFVSEVAGESGERIYRANVGAMQKWLSKNEKELENFPDAVQAVKNAIATEEGRIAMIAKAKDTNAHFEKVSIWGQLSKDKHPIELVKSAINSIDPVQKLQPMIDLAKKNGERGVLALRATLLEGLTISASDKYDAIDFPHLIAMIKSTSRGSKTSIMDHLVKEGIFDGEVLGRIDKIARIAANLSVSQRPGFSPGAIPDEVDLLVQHLVGGFSATQGPKIARGVFGEGVGGHSLLLAQRASSFGTKLYDMIPMRNRKSILIDMLSDPKLFAEIMEQAKGVIEDQHKRRFFTTFLVSRNYLNYYGDEEPELSQGDE